MGQTSERLDNLMLVYLRRIDASVVETRQDILELKRRMTSPEASVALLHGDFAGQSARIDPIELRLERIERRLDLAGAPNA